MRVTTSLFRVLLIAAAVSPALPATAAPFVYRGALSDGGRPAEGDYGFRLTFYDLQTGGNAVAAPITLDGVTVRNGTFDAALELGPALERRSNLWLAVEVRSADGAYVPLSDREHVQPKAIAAGVCWDTTGNGGNVDGVNFLGNLDNVPLDFRANNSRVLRLEPKLDTNYGRVPNVIAGSPSNGTGPATIGATVAGGGSVSAPNEPSCFGCGNRAIGNFSTVGGGRENRAAGEHATVSGGEGNIATGLWSSVGGGSDNSARDNNATVGGGRSNSAEGAWSVVPGGDQNFAGGAYSFAAGYSARVRGVEAGGQGDAGTFVWSDGNLVLPQFISTGQNQFLIRASGGVGVNTNNPVSDGEAVSLKVKGFATLPGSAAFESPKGPSVSHIHYGATGDWYIRSAANTGKVVIADNGGKVGVGTSVVGVGNLISTSANGASLTTGGAWTNGSSRLFKEAFASVDAGAILDKVLALPLATWRYKNSEEGSHLGPMAEDFSAAFGLGADAQHIATVDADGVALAAIQGLNEKLERENRELRDRLLRIERLVQGSLSQ